MQDTADASHDAPAHQADAPGRDAETVAGDAPSDVASDAGCRISAGVTIALDGIADLADYPAGQLLTLGAMLGNDAAAIAWDAHQLYITATSDAFTSPYEPLHVYVEAASELASPTPAQGKQYSGLVPQLPFTPNYLIAARRVTDAGTGAYDGVFTPAQSWTTQSTVFTPGTDVFVSADQRTISVEVPWSALGGCPIALRLAVHVVHAQPANEWKDLVPATHTPWQPPGGDYYQIDLTGATDVTQWQLR